MSNVAIKCNCTSFGGDRSSRVRSESGRTKFSPAFCRCKPLLKCVCFMLVICSSFANSAAGFGGHKSCSPNLSNTNGMHHMLLQRRITRIPW